MNGTAFVLVAVATVAGSIASTAPVSGYADDEAAQRRTP